MKQKRRFFAFAITFEMWVENLLGLNPVCLKSSSNYIFEKQWVVASLWPKRQLNRGIQRNSTNPVHWWYFYKCDWLIAELFCIYLIIFQAWRLFPAFSRTQPSNMRQMRLAMHSSYMYYQVCRWCMLDFDFSKPHDIYTCSWYLLLPLSMSFSILHSYHIDVPLSVYILIRILVRWKFKPSHSAHCKLHTRSKSKNLTLYYLLMFYQLMIWV